MIVMAIVASVVGANARSSDAGAATSTGRAFAWSAPIPPINSTYGSGHFGQWAVDGFGLPSYDYTVDQQTDPIARQAELAGSDDAWSQVGNDRVKADAFNHGYTELWSQDRLAQWINKLDPSHDHMGGGFGYLNVDGNVTSTLYDDRPQSAATQRTFGVGYFGHLGRQHPSRCTRERLRTIRKRSCPRPRHNHHEHLDPSREHIVVRVLGRESLRPEPAAVPRASPLP